MTYECVVFLLTPLREGRHYVACFGTGLKLFLLTPLREGRLNDCDLLARRCRISTHAPAGGATLPSSSSTLVRSDFYSRPCGRGDYFTAEKKALPTYFYSRPCGRGDLASASVRLAALLFLLTPLREGRPEMWNTDALGALFLLTPLREGRQWLRKSAGERS